MGAKKVKQPVPPISEWGVLKHGVKALYVNPDRGFGFSDECALDVEDDEKGGFVGIGIYDPKLNVCYYWTDPAGLHQIPPFIGHNGRTDVEKLRSWGYPIDESWLIWDTQIMAHLLDSSRRMYSLKPLSKEDLGIEYPSYEDLTGIKTSKDHITLAQLPVELVSHYNAMDCFATWKLYEKQRSLCA